jgi:hypothetical protein
MVAGCVFDNINKRFDLCDFKVYYEASHAILNGKQLYDIAFTLGSGYFKYSPFTALLAAPISILPYSVASLVQYFILASAAIIVLIMAYNLALQYLFMKELKYKNLLLFVVFICFIIQLVRELHLGNINLILLLLLTLSLKLLLKERFVLAGVLLALVIITKPFFILLLMPLVLHKYGKTVLSIIGSLLAFLILPAIVTGFSKNIELHKQWLSTMLGHASAFPSSNTLSSLINRFMLHSENGKIQYIILGAICAAYIILFYFIKRERTEKSLKKDFIIEWFLIIALMPSLFPTDTNHFLLSVPIILILCYYLFSSRNMIATILFVIAIILYDNDSTDLIGNKLSAWVEDNGLLGISNIILIVMIVILYFGKIRPDSGKPELNTLATY